MSDQDLTTGKRSQNTDVLISIIMKPDPEIAAKLSILYDALLAGK